MQSRNIARGLWMILGRVLRLSDPLVLEINIYNNVSERLQKDQHREHMWIMKIVVDFTVGLFPVAQTIDIVPRRKSHWSSFS